MYLSWWTTGVLCWHMSTTTLKPPGGFNVEADQCYTTATDFILGLSPYSHDYSFIVSGSEDKYVYIWSTYHDLSKFTSVRRDRNDFWEGIKGNSAVCSFIKCLMFDLLIELSLNNNYLSAHNAVVTSAIFAPHPGLIVPQETGAEKPEADCKSLDSTDSETIPSGMLTFCSQLIVNRFNDRKTAILVLLNCHVLSQEPWRQITQRSFCLLTSLEP